MAQADGGPTGPSRFGIRYEDLTEDERAYYRDFLPGAEAGAATQAPTATGLETPSPKKALPRRGSTSRWMWVPHSLTALALIMAVASFLVVPAVYSDLSPELRRNYVIMWAELAFFFLLFAALLYGIFALARFTDHDDDDDDRLMRPTDYADQLLERDIDRVSRRLPPDELYDSTWITGKKN